MRKTKEELEIQIKEDIEVFGKDKIVYCWYDNGELIDYTYEPQGNCRFPEYLSCLWYSKHTPTMRDLEEADIEMPLIHRLRDI